MEKTTKQNSCTSSKQQAMKSIQAVEIIPTSNKPELSPFINVRIGNCELTVTNNTDMKLLRKISEAFNDD